MEKVLEAVEPLLDTLRPYLEPMLIALPAPVQTFISSQLGPQCTTQMLALRPTAACTQLALSKGLGIGVITLSAVVKLPQLLKILSSGSVAGLSFPGYVLETASFAISCAYNARSGFPFSTFGESALIAVQNIVIATLILQYTGRATLAAAWVGAAGASAYALANDHIVPADLLSTFMMGAGALAVASKLPQIYTIYQQGGTGQLSAFAVFGFLFGSLSRIYTTLQEVPDKLVLFSFLAGGSLNLIIALQMLYYWNSPTSAPHARELGKKPERLAQSIGKGVSSASATGAQAKAKTPTTRRRG